MNYRPLGRTGVSVSCISFGASPLGETFGSVDSREAARAVHLAIDRGMNYFDVSPYYGNTLAEQRLGEALVSHRSAVVVSTKCGRYGLQEFDFSFDRITAELENSLRRLQTDHVDLLLAHDIEFAMPAQIVAETIPAMRRLQQAGKTRFIGISGYPIPELVRTIEQAELDAVLSYCHYDFLNTDMEERLTPLAKQKRIGLINASPLHMGLLGGLPAPEWHPASYTVQRYGPLFATMCREYGLEPATVALRFCIEHPYVATTLIGIASRAQVEQNVAALDAVIPSELRTRIALLLAPVQNMVWVSGRPDANRWTTQTESVGAD